MPAKKKTSAAKRPAKKASTASSSARGTKAAGTKAAGTKKRTQTKAATKKAAPTKKTKTTTTKKKTKAASAAAKQAASTRRKTAAKKPATGKARKTSAPMTAKKSAAGGRAAGKKPIPTAVKRKRSKALNALVEVGRDRLGIEDLRPGQAEALQHVLDGRDVLAVMPTGSGKSLLYQLPALQLPGLTVVVSPLIALIKDQVDKMVQVGVPVARIDSTLTTKQRREMDALILEEGGKLVLTTPERMADPDFRTFLNRGAGGKGVSLFVVDEAHCVSHWGHDFRPSYLVLRRAIRDLGRPQLLATTATAPPHVRDDILEQLDAPDAAIVTTTFDRPNLHYEVIALPGDDDKKKTLVSLLKKLPRPGLVYCATVRAVKQLHEQMARHGVPVAMYHGRMTKKERTEQQNRFMPARSDLIMIATNAFGLGVDKPDIRYVLHFHVPGSLEQYAQEAGRGGRDDKPTRCVLLFSPDDVAIQEYFLKGSYPTRRQVRAVVSALEAWDASNGDDEDEALPTLANVALASQVGKQRTRTVLNLLQSESWVDEDEDHLFSLSDPPPERAEVNEKAKQYEARRIADRQRLQALLDYVAAPGCRSQVILEYLGEGETPECGRCDNCLRSREAALAAAREAAGLESALTRVLAEEESDFEEKPRRIIRHRVVSIDEHGKRVDEQPAPTQAAEAGAPAPAAETDELEQLIAEQQADEEEFEYEYVDEDEEFVDEEGYEYGEVEIIDKTAAALAEEDDDLEDAEITILKRKHRDKPTKKKARPTQAPEQKKTKKKRRRRRRRKKKVALPSVASFSSPVLDGEEAALQRAAKRDEPVPAPGNGPVVEYVRSSMRINSTPVASATPNDQPGKGKRRRRRKPGPSSRQAQQPNGQAQPASPAPPSAEAGAAGDEAAPPKKTKKKRRRRHRRRKGAAGSGSPSVDGPISFFSMAVGPGNGSGRNGAGNAAPKKKRRRRRRRGGAKKEGGGGSGDSPPAPSGDDS